MISVVMPVHRNDIFLETALDSIFENLIEVSGELILIIDSKDENTIGSIKNKVTAVNKKYSISCRVEESPGHGIVDALNFGFSLAMNEFIARMDSDDVMASNRLSTQLAFLQSRSGIVAVGSNIMLIDELGQDIREVSYPQGPQNLKTALEKGSFLAHPSVMLRKSAFYEAGGYNDTYRYAEDFDLWTRLATVGDLDNIPEILLKYRSHSGQISQLKRKDQDLSTRAIVLRNRIEKGLVKRPGWDPMNFEDLERWVSHVEEIATPHDKMEATRVNNLDDLILKSRRHYQFGEYRQTLGILLQAFAKHPKPILKFVWLAMKKRINQTNRTLKSPTENNYTHLKSIENPAKPNKNHLVVVVLKGGMGNQLFQFFTGLELSRRTGRGIALDLTELDKDRKRDFALESVINDERFKEITIFQKNEAFPRPCGCGAPHHILEKSFHYTNFEIPEDRCLRLDGYWQSWKYFVQINKEIPNYFDTLSEIERFSGVTIHVRGGDMLRETQHFLFHGVLTKEYYEKALSLFPGKKIRVITDDVEYAQEIFHKKMGLQVEIVSSTNTVLDFMQLRNSEHLIIANSTFSWWAAFVGSSKSVIAPRAWFSPEGLEKNDISDLFPTQWILV